MGIIECGANEVPWCGLRRYSTGTTWQQLLDADRAGIPLPCRTLGNRARVSKKHGSGVAKCRWGWETPGSLKSNEAACECQLWCDGTVLACWENIPSGWGMMNPNDASVHPAALALLGFYWGGQRTKSAPFSRYSTGTRNPYGAVGGGAGISPPSPIWSRSPRRQLLFPELNNSERKSPENGFTAGKHGSHPCQR